jgi:hypothetical protein
MPPIHEGDLLFAPSSQKAGSVKQEIPTVHESAKTGMSRYSSEAGGRFKWFSV